MQIRSLRCAFQLDSQRMGSRPEPLYLFTLPPALLADITPRQLSLPSTKSIEPAPTQPLLPPAAAKNGLFNCTITGATFTELDALKAHYKSDWYKYNVKLRLKGITIPVSEEEFDKLVERQSCFLPSIRRSNVDAISIFRTFRLHLRLRFQRFVRRLDPVQQLLHERCLAIITKAAARSSAAEQRHDRGGRF